MRARSDDGDGAVECVGVVAEVAEESVAGAAEEGSDALATGVPAGQQVWSRACVRDLSQQKREITHTRARPHLLPRRTSCGQCVRALLCSPCNRLLGHLRDNTDALHRAITVIRDRPAQAVLNSLDTKDHQ